MACKDCQSTNTVSFAGTWGTIFKWVRNATLCNDCGSIYAESTNEEA